MASCGMEPQFDRKIGTVTIRRQQSRSQVLSLCSRETALEPRVQCRAAHEHLNRVTPRKKKNDR